jgi:hypothetical protein
MPWCPKCKTEYRDGFTVCPDCNVELVEQLEEEKMITISQAEEIGIAKKFIQYLSYSGIEASITYNGETEAYMVSVPAAKQKQSRKLYQAFYQVEIAKQDDENHPQFSNQDEQADDAALNDEDLRKENKDEGNATNESGKKSDYGNDFKEDSAIYVMKADQYKDLNSTVWVFLLFGIAGMLVIFLNVAGILKFINGIIQYIVLTALFLFFIYVGLSTNSKAKKVKAEIETENKLTADINQWLKNNVTENFLSSIHNNSISEELNYLKKTNTVKNMLIKEFGSQNSAYVDRLIEEYYNRTFENN